MQHRIAEVPLPVRIRSHPTDPGFSYLSSKHQTKSVPPKPNCFVADVNASFVQKIFNLAETQRVTYVIHHCQSDDFGRRFEVFEGRTCCHLPKIGINREIVKFV